MDSSKRHGNGNGEKFDSTLKELGLKPTDYDSCVYNCVYTTTDGNLQLALYVDDG